MDLKKTLFGNYRGKDVEAYVEGLREEFQQTTQGKDKQIEELTAKVKDLEHKTAEIGEAVIYAKNLVIESRRKADAEARAIVEDAQRGYKDMKDSLLAEIDSLLEKREQAVELYKATKAQIARGMADLDGQLSSSYNFTEEFEDFERKQQTEEVAEDSEETVDVSNVFRIEDAVKRVG